MEREIFWYTLGGTAEDAVFTASAMATLLDRLRHALPGLKLRGSEMAGELLKEVVPKLRFGFLDGAVEAIRDSWSRDTRGATSHVTVYCPDPQSPAVLVARRRLKHAAWGISLAGALSLTYAQRNRYALWHESLHLLGAQDHYDPQTFAPTCGLPTCIMQYASDENTVGSQPFLCPATAAILRKACS